MPGSDMRDARRWGWGFGFLLSAGSCLGYILSRMIGLPGMKPEEWLNPTGILSLAVEFLYLLLMAFVFTKPIAKKVPGILRHIRAE